MLSPVLALSFNSGRTPGSERLHLDSNNNLDIVVVNSNGPDQIFLGNGNGTFPPTGSALGTSNSQAVAIGNLNSGGVADIVVASNGSAEILLGNGNGTFASTSVLTTGNSQAVAIGHLNTDNSADLIIVDGSSQANQVWLNNGSGGFGTDPAQTFGTDNSNAVAIGDLDLDGDLDVVIANGSPGNGQGNQVLFNQDVKVFTVDPPGRKIDLSEGLSLNFDTAVSQTTTFTYTPRVAPTLPGTSSLTFAGKSFSLDATQSGQVITDPFGSGGVVITAQVPAGQSVANIFLYYEDNNEWFDVATTCTPESTYNRGSNWLNVTLCHLTDFGLFTGAGDNVFLPVILKDN